MKQVLLFLGGFLLTMTGLTLFGSLSFYAIATLYWYALFLLFFGPYKAAAAFLLGLTVGMELLGDVRFGLATALSLVVLVLYQLFSLQLRFTARSTRFIVSLLLMLAAYCLLLFPRPHLVERLGQIAILFPFLAIAAYLLTYRTDPTLDELL